jgi:predicted nucleotidyltransferase
MNIIFKAIVGSHAYGTNIEGSDIDYKGIYLQDPEDVLQNGYREQVTITDDEVYYELRRFIELCCTNNPGMLELLYSPEDCIVHKDPVFDVILQNRDKFLSKSCRHSYGGYAFAQIEKASGLNKKMNWENSKIEKKSVLDFCYILPWITQTKGRPLREWLLNNGLDQSQCGLVAIDNFRYTYGLYIRCLEGQNYKGIVQDEETSNDVSLSSVDKDVSRDAVMYFNKDGYGKYCKDYASYQVWLKERNVQRYVDSDAHGQKIDGKNLLHCVRLLETGIEVAKERTLNVRRPNAEYLISIRKGKVDLQTLLDASKEKMKELDEAFQQSDLPDKVDRGFWLALMPKIRKEYYDKNTA